MSQVYTFCKSGGSKSSAAPINSATPVNKPAPSGVITSSGYSYKREDTKNTEPKPVAFTEDDFPSLGGSTKQILTPNPTKNIGSWGDASKISIIREPFTNQIAVPKKNIPPLFSKVKKTKKVMYEDEDDEDEEEQEFDDYYDTEPDEYRVDGSWGFGNEEEDEF